MAQEATKIIEDDEAFTILVKIIGPAEIELTNLKDAQ